VTPDRERCGLEDLFLQYGVDFVFSGHTHHYERTFPVKKSVATQHDYTNPRGIIHVQSGIAGVDGYDVPQEDWESFGDTNFTHSYSRIIFHDESHATVQQLRNSDGSVLDEFTVTQNKHGSFL